MRVLEDGVMRSFVVWRLGRGLGVDVSGRRLYRWGESGG